MNSEKYKDPTAEQAIAHIDMQRKDAAYVTRRLEQAFSMMSHERGFTQKDIAQIVRIAWKNFLKNDKS